MATKSTATKKVRSACRRCRARRIKCDGQMPACSNCAKAGQACIDVDSQNSDVFVPRNFARAARARIQWLEGVIRERLPDFDLTSGPQISLSLESDRSNIVGVVDDSFSGTLIESTNNPQASASSQTEQAHSRKRVAGESSSTDNDDSFPEGAHSVAFNLGMLSLNSDSSQKHYLGSSSGLLFTNIIGASPSPEASTSATARITSDTHQDQYLSQSSQSNLQPRYWSLHQLLRQELPKQTDGLLLLQTYLREVHPDYPALEPSSLFSAFEALYACSSQLVDNDSLVHGWPSTLKDFYWNGQHVRPDQPASEDVPMPVIAFIFFMIFNIAAIIKVRMRVYEYSPEKYYRTALMFSGDSFSRTSVSSIQALIMLMIHSLLTPAETNLWTLVHIGMAHCVELGLHREPSQPSLEDPAFLQVRRYIFYVIYSLDRSISTIQGRPLGLRDEAFDVRMPAENITSGSVSNVLIPPTFQGDVLQYSTHQFNLDRIISDIKTHLYHLPVESMQFPWPQNPTDHQDRISKILQVWWDNARRTISGLTALDTYHKQLWNLKTKIKYNTTVILLYQPSQVARQPTEIALQKCFNSACDILQSYQLLQDWHCLQYDWRAVQSVFAAGATIVYTFWSSKVVQKNASITDLSKALRSCSSLLSVGGEWWPSVRRGKSSFETVVDLTIRKLYTNGTSSKQPRLAAQHQKDRYVPAPSVRSSKDRPLNEILPHQAIQYNIDITRTTAPQETFEHWGDTQSITDQFAFQTRPPESSGITEPSPETQDLGLLPEIEDFLGEDRDPESQGLGLLLEIEDFLADFDNADFSWNMPLYGFDTHDDLAPFFDATSLFVQGGETEQSDYAL